MATTNYVKFLRGSYSAYQAKVDAGTVDENTLYFVYDATSSTKGQLYLGSRLLTGGSSSSSINDLIDSNQISSGDVLYYDGEKWINKSIYSSIDDMTPSTATINGYRGLVPTPLAGDNLKFLRGDGTWEQEYINSINTNLFTINDGKLGIKENISILSDDDKTKLGRIEIDDDGNLIVTAVVSGMEWDQF